jgi:hypothetical protein
MITVELDPRLALPPVKGVEHGQTDVQSIPEYDSVSVSEVALDEVLYEGVQSADGQLPPPQNVVILSQFARISDTGQIVVDVLLDILDVPGAREYEVRVAVG